ncbi:excisionase family DNA-binding protein [Pseudoclavibacter sp. CFCC 13611]|uniref:excisionase family DNA-binding protein n=1 Tax=Pseudoclavibacter sp. CFCC 13611 TaxID=2615178 RepID=UPI001300D92A|nr:excisionase family DNA-binding protein [Pseudoclavibacter sp. CFCC 13611]KAB1662930.1 DNA-binding protein [Pseudoclavibacter sp. CFCC 13611]
MRSKSKYPCGVSLEDLQRSSAATITRTEAAAVMGIDPRTVSKGIAEGTIPSIKIGRLQMIPRERFLALFDCEAA